MRDGGERSTARHGVPETRRPARTIATMPPHTFRRAVVATVLSDAAAPEAGDVEDDVQRFVADGIGAMPPHLRLGVRALEVLLAAATVLRSRHDLARLGPDERLAQVRSWETSRLGPANQYVRLIRSLVLFAAHERAVA